MLSSLIPVRSFLLAIFIIMAGSGFLSTLISVRLEAEGESPLAIGLVGTAYFAGLTIGALRVSKLIASVGHIRAFAVFVSIFSASSLTYAIHQDVGLWTVLRFIDGLTIAGVYICLESWLNERADKTSRASILASYMVALYSGQAAGQFLLNLGDAQPMLPFMVSAILLSLAVIPVVLTQVAQPVLGNLKSLSIRKLYEISPLGILGVILTGAMLGAFYALGPIFAGKLGMGLSEIALFTSSVIFGGVILQWPIGMLSDRFDRRKVLIACFALATAVCGAMIAIGGTGIYVFILGGLFGGFSFVLYPLCVAHTNDRLAEDERVGASGGLVLAYSMGAVGGPLLGSAVMAVIGPPGLFLFIGMCALLGTGFGLWRLYSGEAVPSEEQQSYQNLPRTTPVATSFDDET